MTYEQFLRELGKAGLSVREFADLVKMNKNSISNYSCRGEIPEHLAIIAALLGEMREHSINFYSVFDRIDIEPKKPRGNAKQGRFGGDRQAELSLDQ